MVVIVDRIIILGLLYTALIQAMRIVGIHLWFPFPIWVCKFCKRVSYVLMINFVAITGTELIMARGYLSTELLPELISVWVGGLLCMVSSELLAYSGALFDRGSFKYVFYRSVTIVAVVYPLFKYIAYVGGD